MGSEEENGGWPPHVHFQLSLIEPEECDLPGVVSEENHDIALKIFPDPRMVLGKSTSPFSFVMISYKNKVLFISAILS